MATEQIQTFEEQPGSPQLPWKGLTEPGAYVETQTGRLFRIVPEDLAAGLTPFLRPNCTELPRFIQLSKSPYISVFDARMLAAEHNVKPCF